MERVTNVRGKAIPLDRANVDTDQIIPAQYMKRIERTGYGPFAFLAWRNDPDFVLNNPAHAGATIMLTRSNFGSGSSREHAVWAIEGMGVRALIGTSFADIFKNNCFQRGLLTVELPDSDIDYLMARAEELPDTGDHRRPAIADRAHRRRLLGAALRDRPVQEVPPRARPRRHRHDARVRARHRHLRAEPLRPLPDNGV